MPSATVGSLPLSICVADFDNNGMQDAVVINAGANNLSFLAGDDKGNFSLKNTFQAGYGPRGICSADFNKDGKADIAVCGPDIRIFLNSGNAAKIFSASTVFTVDAYPYSIITADFNGDGNADIATCSTDSSNVSVLLGDGKGALSAAMEFIAGTTPHDLSAGDFNGDHKTDIVATNYDYTDRIVSVLLNSGAGSFSPAVTFTTNVVPLTPVAADINNDGFDDIVVAGFSNLDVLMNTGKNNFIVSATMMAGGSGSAKVTAQDFNGDGKQDLASCSYGAKQAHIFAGHGNGTFNAPMVYTLNNGPMYITSADLNSDTKNDLLVVNYNADNLSVLINASPKLSVTATSELCSNKNVTLTVSGAKNYAWSNGSTDSAIVIPPLGPANYTVTGTSEIGCTSTYAYTADSGPCTQIEEYTGENNMVVAPNPFTDNIKIKNPGHRLLNCAVYNVNGEEIVNIRSDSEEVAIDLSMQTPGVYQIHIKCGTINTSRKLVKLQR